MLPFESCPPVIHLGQEEGEKLSPERVFFHLLVKAVLLHKTDSAAQVRDFLTAPGAAFKDGFRAFYGVMVFLIFYHHGIVHFGKEGSSWKIHL